MQSMVQSDLHLGKEWVRCAVGSGAAGVFMSGTLAAHILLCFIYLSRARRPHGRKFERLRGHMDPRVRSVHCGDLRDVDRGHGHGWVHSMAQS